MISLAYSSYARNNARFPSNPLIKRVPFLLLKRPQNKKGKRVPLGYPECVRGRDHLKGLQELRTSLGKFGERLRVRGP